MTTTGFPLIDGMAEALWRLHWVDCGPKEHSPASNIVSLYAPETSVPLGAIVDAARIVGMYEQANGVPIDRLLYRAAMADAAGDELTRDRLFADVRYARSFGRHLAHMALGRSASWFDSHMAFDLRLPDEDVAEPVASLAEVDERDQPLRFGEGNGMTL